MKKQNKYQINGSVVSQINGGPLIWYHSDGSIFSVKLSSPYEAAKLVASLIENECDHNIGWDIYGEKLSGC